MFSLLFYEFFLFMGTALFVIHPICKSYGLENRFFEKYSVNCMRSIVCTIIANEGFRRLPLLLGDSCHDSEIVVSQMKDYNEMFLSYFVYDTTIMFIQVYRGIEKNMRLDLLFHHVLGIVALIAIDYYKMYGLSLYVGMSEGMSIVSGMKLIAMQKGWKVFSNTCVYFRLVYLVVVRMMFIWPALFIHYNWITHECDKFAENKNALLVFLMLATIYHTEIFWLHNGRKELARI